MLLSACATSPSGHPTSFRLRPGDLLFQDLDGSPLCDAIETVTHGVNGAKFSHVGVVCEVTRDEVKIIEAVSRGVVETNLDEFLGRSRDDAGRPKVLVGRLKPEYRRYIPEALDAARKFLGKPYDSVYVMGNGSLYCSELVYEAFHAVAPKTSMFEITPMTFKDPFTRQTFPAWTEYYSILGLSIPEGEPGLNPGSISRSSAITIVHAYGRPTGWRGPD